MIVRPFPSVLSNKKLFTLLMASALLTACGGGGGDTSSPNGQTNNGGANNGGSVTTPPSNPDNSNSTDNISNQSADVSKDFADKGGITDSVTGLNPSEASALNVLNSARIQCGFGALKVNAELQKSADNHANYLAYALMKTKTNYGHSEVKNKNPFYSGNRPVDRIKTTNTKGILADKVYYNHANVAENISLATVTGYTINATFDRRAAEHGMRGLLAAPYHMASLLEQRYQDVGVSYRRTTVSGANNVTAQSIILEIMSALAAGKTPATITGTLHYPCQGIKNTAFEITNESPDPMPNGQPLSGSNAIGQPVYIQSAKNSNLSIIAYSMREKATGKNVPLQLIHKNNDPAASNGMIYIQSHQAILMPLGKLKANTTYSVSYQATVNGVGVGTKNFDFTTIADQRLLNIR